MQYGTLQFLIFSMKHLVLYLILAAELCMAQTALYNTGNFRIHEQGKIGFHTDLINNSSFTDNEGLAGFYGDQRLEVSGAFAPFFYDLEIVNASGVVLNTSVNVINNANFVIGDFITPRAVSDVGLNFLPSSFYIGENNSSKTDGYAGISGTSGFTFPIGDEQQLRPLSLNSTNNFEFAKSAYFFENPNDSGFSTAIKTEILVSINVLEYWKLESNILGNVSISWNARSDMASIATEIDLITIVGWSISQRQWVALGNIAVSGDLNAGTIISAAFVPDDYAAITFGVLAEPAELLDLEDYWLSPNNDGINDVLIIPELEQSPNNKIQIFDRNGIRVFEQLNYIDQFRGFANTGSWVLNQNKGLPTGIYYYTAELYDLGLSYQGFLYLER